MFTKEIILPFDLSGRKAVMFCQAIQESTRYLVLLKKEERQINARSLLGTLSLSAWAEDKILLLCQLESEIVIVEEIINTLLKEGL